MKQNDRRSGDTSSDMHNPTHHSSTVLKIDKKLAAARQEGRSPSTIDTIEAELIGGSRNWEDGRSTGKVFSGLRRMSEDSGAGRPVARRRKRYSGSSSGAGDGEAHEYLGAYAAVAALVRARCMAQIQESQESTEMDMVPGPEVVRTLSFVDQEARGAGGTSVAPAGGLVGVQHVLATQQWDKAQLLELRGRVRALSHRRATNCSRQWPRSNRPHQPNHPIVSRIANQLCDDSVCAATPQLLYARVQDDNDNTSHVGGSEGSRRQ
eukprot:scaffold7841_cov128-Isochrysis_galbana.AAC.1